jgi:hypothetical protein
MGCSRSVDYFPFFSISIPCYSTINRSPLSFFSLSFSMAVRREEPVARLKKTRLGQLGQSVKKNVLFSRGPFYIWHMPHFLFCIGRKTWRRPCRTSARRIAARIEVLINFQDQRPVCCYAKIKSATQSRNQLGLSITDLMARQFDDSAIPAPLLASQDSGFFRKIEFGLICRMHADRGSLLLWSSFLCLILLYLHIRVYV